MLGTGCNFLHTLNTHPTVSRSCQYFGKNKLKCSFPSSPPLPGAILGIYIMLNPAKLKRCPFTDRTGDKQGCPAGHKGLSKAKIEIKNRAVTSICPCKQKRKEPSPDAVKIGIILTAFQRKFAPSSTGSLEKEVCMATISSYSSLSSCKFQAQEAPSSLPSNGINMSGEQISKGSGLLEKMTVCHTEGHG